MNKKEEKIRKILNKYSNINPYESIYYRKYWKGNDSGIIQAMLEFGEECFNAGKKYGIDCAISAEWCEEVTESNFENYLNSLE